MEYKGYRFDNLYRDAENDIIDELKDEVVYLKKKMKDYNHRENNLEDELGEVSNENKKLKNEIKKMFEETKKFGSKLEEKQNTEDYFVRKN